MAAENFEETIRSFRDEYINLLRDHDPIGEWGSNSQTRESWKIILKAKGFRPNVFFTHSIKSSTVDLTLQGDCYGLLEQYPPPGTTLQDTGKSHLYKVDVPLLKWDQPLSKQISALSAAFSEILKLHKWAFRHIAKKSSS